MNFAGRSSLTSERLHKCNPRDLSRGERSDVDPRFIEGRAKRGVPMSNLLYPARRRSAGQVVLIGGGSSSALTAIRLAERGFRVIVLEKAKIGNGSSTRSAAGIRAQFLVDETAICMHN